MVEIDKRYRVPKRGNLKVQAVWPAPSSNPEDPCWWVLPLESGQPTRQYGWMAFRESEMEAMK